jgi:hypothetical protein
MRNLSTRTSCLLILRAWCTGSRDKAPRVQKKVCSRPSASSTAASPCTTLSSQEDSERSESPEKISSDYSEDASVNTEDSVLPDQDDCKEEFAMAQYENPSQHAFHSMPAHAGMLEEMAVPHHVPLRHPIYLPERSMVGEFVDESWFYLHQKLVRNAPPPPCLLPTSISFAMPEDSFLWAPVNKRARYNHANVSHVCAPRIGRRRTKDCLLRCAWCWKNRTRPPLRGRTTPKQVLSLHGMEGHAERFSMGWEAWGCG